MACKPRSYCSTRERNQVVYTTAWDKGDSTKTKTRACAKFVLVELQEQNVTIRIKNTNDLQLLQSGDKRNQVYFPKRKVKRFLVLWQHGNPPIDIQKVNRNMTSIHILPTNVPVSTNERTQPARQYYLNTHIIFYFILFYVSPIFSWFVFRTHWLKL